MLNCNCVSLDQDKSFKVNKDKMKPHQEDSVKRGDECIKDLYETEKSIQMGIAAGKSSRRRILF